jgi:hypothetical protein
MSDLRAKVLALPPYLDEDGYERSAYSQADILALIPQGAVLVTEETLADALEAHWPREMAPHPGARACAPDILRHLREGT